MHIVFIPCFPLPCLRDLTRAVESLQRPQLSRTMSFGGKTMHSASPFGASMRRNRSSAASRPMSRAPMATVVSAGRCMRAFRNVVEADHGDVAARRKAGSARPNMTPRAQRSLWQIIRAWRRASRLKQLGHRARPALAGWQTIDDRPDRQTKSLQELAEGASVRSIAGVTCRARRRRRRCACVQAGSDALPPASYRGESRR